MTFNRDNFNENVDYCEYIYYKSLENGLQLGNKDIQCIANMYTFELYCLDLYSEDEVVENEEVLQKVYDDYVANHKNNQYNEIDYGKVEALNELRIKYERIFNSKGGYAFNDNYDDFSLEEKSDAFELKMKKYFL